MNCKEGNMTVKRMGYSITIESIRTFPRATRRNTQTRGKSVTKGAWIINLKFNTWHLKKRCLEFKQCKGFTWHKDKHRNPKLSKACSLFSTYSYKGDGNSVSGLRECSGELNTRSEGIGRGRIGGEGGNQSPRNLVGMSALPTGIFLRPESFYKIDHEIKPKHQHKSEKVLKCIRLSGKFPQSLESFQTSLNSFQRVWKVCR